MNWIWFLVFALSYFGLLRAFRFTEKKGWEAASAICASFIIVAGYTTFLFLVLALCDTFFPGVSSGGAVPVGNDPGYGIPW